MRLLGVFALAFKNHKSIGLMTFFDFVFFRSEGWKWNTIWKPWTLSRGSNLVHRQLRKLQPELRQLGNDRLHAVPPLRHVHRGRLHHHRREDVDELSSCVPKDWKILRNNCWRIFVWKRSWCCRGCSGEIENSESVTILDNILKVSKNKNPIKRKN